MYEVTDAMTTDDVLQAYGRVRVALRRVLGEAEQTIAYAALMATVGETVERVLYQDPVSGERAFVLLQEVVRRLEHHRDLAVGRLH